MKADRLTPFEHAQGWAQSIQHHAPVSPHHERAVQELIAFAAPYLPRPGTALEVGAGEPPFLTARFLRECGWSVTTQDAIEPAADFGGDLHDLLPMDSDSVDLVVARHVLEHVLCPYVALMEMMRVTRALLLIVVPWDSEKVRDWPDHLWFLTRPGWELIFERLGLKVLVFEEGDHTEDYAKRDGMWDDREWRYVLSKGE